VPPPSWRGPADDPEPDRQRDRHAHRRRVAAQRGEPQRGERRQRHRHQHGADREQRPEEVREEDGVEHAVARDQDDGVAQHELRLGEQPLLLLRGEPGPGVGRDGRVVVEGGGRGRAAGGVHAGGRRAPGGVRRPRGLQATCPQPAASAVRDAVAPGAGIPPRRHVGGGPSAPDRRRAPATPGTPHGACPAAGSAGRRRMHDVLPLLPALLCLVAGIAALVVPEEFARRTGLVAVGPLGRSELRAVFGGVFVGIGLATLLVRTPDAHLVGGAGFLGGAAAKVLSAGLERGVLPAAVPGLVVDVVLGALFLWSARLLASAG
jgi:hypothetical protein